LSTTRVFASLIALCLTFAALMANTNALAQALAKPTGAVVLTISGKIGQTNAASVAEFDEMMLDALPATRISTATPWRKGVATFAGPSLKSILALVGARGQTLKMTALDQYEIKVPIDDAEKFSPVLARKIDGVTLKVKDQGPLFMVYPFDAMPGLKNDVYYGRSIWHLTRIEVQ
jgi:hypothetical protein